MAQFARQLRPRSPLQQLIGRFLLLTFCFLTLVGCSPLAIPTKPYPTASPTSSTAVPTPTGSPLPSVTPSPLPAPEWEAALRPAFVDDLSILPEAPRYRIDLSVDLDTAAAYGHETLAYTNTEEVPLEALYLRLFPNTPGYGGAMTVTKALLNEKPATFTTEFQGSALRFPLNPPLEPGSGVDLALDFTLDLPTQDSEGGEGYRQLGYYDGVLALANAYPLIPVYDDEGWNIKLAPTHGDAVYSDAAFYEVRITTPATMTLAASGSCAASASGTEEKTWHCIAPLMRDFNAIVGLQYQVEQEVVEGIGINSIHYADHQEGGMQALDYASGAARVFSERFGPYPFTKLDVIETPTLAGGVEYPGLVVINSSYYASTKERMEWVVVHEVGHQWWYSLVGNDQVDEPWLDEALVQYSTLLYFEDRYGEEAASNLIEQVFRQPYEELQEEGRDKPAGLPVAAYSGMDYGAVVYQKGPLYFHALRQEVGDEDFDAILRTYFERHRYGIATPEDWLAAVEAVTGDQHRDLYGEWIGSQ